MTKLIFTSLLVVGLLSATVNVHSATTEQLLAMQKVELQGDDLFLNGLGEVKKLSGDYYIGALYLPSKTTIDTDIVFQETPKRLIIKFMIDRVSGRAFGRELANSLNINNVPEELEAFQRDMRRVVQSFKGFYAKGDEITFDYIPDSGLFIGHNGDRLTIVTTRGADKLLFKAFLGDKPFSPSFKKGLVGGNENAEQIRLQRQFVDLDN